MLTTIINVLTKIGTVIRVLVVMLTSLRSVLAIA